MAKKIIPEGVKYIINMLNDTDHNLILVIKLKIHTYNKERLPDFVERL